MEQNINMQGGPQRMAVNQFAAKFSSKKDLFNFLSVEVGAYLCDHEVLTIYFLKQLVSGKKKCKFPNTPITALCRHQV